jgi:hypothetical protein
MLHSYGDSYHCSSVTPFILTATLQHNYTMYIPLYFVSQQVQIKSSGAPTISSERLQQQQLLQHQQLQQQQPLEQQALQKEQLQALQAAHHRDAPLSPDRASSASSTAAAAADSEDSGMDFDFDELLTGDVLTGDVDAEGFENASAGGAIAAVLADGGRLSPTPLPTAVLTPSALSALLHSTSTTTALVPLVSGSLYAAQASLSGALYGVSGSSSEQSGAAAGSAQRANGTKKSILKRSVSLPQEAGKAKAAAEPAPAASTVPTSKVMLAVMGHGDGKLPHSGSYAGSSSTASASIRQTKVVVHARVVAVLLLLVTNYAHSLHNVKSSSGLQLPESAYTASQMDRRRLVLLVQKPAQKAKKCSCEYDADTFENNMLATL